MKSRLAYPYHRYKSGRISGSQLALKKDHIPCHCALAAIQGAWQSLRSALAKARIASLGHRFSRLSSGCIPSLCFLVAFKLLVVCSRGR
jgi:hypothetical protein